MKQSNHKNAPSVAVVILNWNGKKWLENFLPSVTKTIYPNLKIVVADNASSDDSVLFLKNNYPDVEVVILDKNYGFAGGYNRALRQISTDYYVLLNSDVEVTPNWVQPVIELMESDEKIAACQPKIKSYHQKTHFEYAGACGGMMDFLGFPFCRGRIFDTLEKDEGQYNDSREVFWAGGCAIFVKSVVYHNLGGLDESFFAHQEEIDLCWRMKNAGFKVMVCPAAEVFHVGGGSLTMGSPFKTYLNYRNNWAMLFKNLSFLHFLWITPQRSFFDHVAAWRALLNGDFGFFKAVYKAHLHIPFLLPQWIKIKHQTQQLQKKHRVGEKNRVGRYKKSIVWQYFKVGVKTFGELK